MNGRDQPGTMPGNNLFQGQPQGFGDHQPLQDGLRAVKNVSKTALSSTEQTFLETNPLSALPILKTAVGAGLKEAAVAGLSDITSNAYAL